MGYVIMTRNPGSGRLIAVVDNDDCDISEFATEKEAVEAASNTTICKAWGYEIVEVNA